MKILDTANFNTSHVNVNRSTHRKVKEHYNYFNTSHVNVNQHCTLICLSVIEISIHLMLMLIRFVVQRSSDVTNFNTSHVNVNQL